MEVQELKDKVKQLEEGQCLLMNWISRLESVVGKIPTSMPCPPPTMPSNILWNFNYEPAPTTPVTPSLLPTTPVPQPNSSLPPTTSSNILSPNFNYEPAPTTPVTPSLLPTTPVPQPNSSLPPTTSSNILSPNFNYEPVIQMLY